MDFFKIASNFFNEPRGRMQSGVIIRFKTTSPMIKVNFIKRKGSDLGALIYGVYVNGVLKEYVKNTLQININSESNKELTYDIVLPFFYGLHFAGLELMEGHTLSTIENTNSKKYIAIGNSITHGVGQTNVASDGTYPFIVAKSMGWELFNLAVGGSGVTELIAEETKQIDAHAISILWGFNNWLSGQNIVDVTMPRYKLLINNLRKYHPHAYIYCLMPTITTKIAPNNYNSAPIDTLINSEKRIVNELISKGDTKLFVVDANEYNTVNHLFDYVHLNNAGASTLADSLIQFVQKVEAMRLSNSYNLSFKDFEYSIMGNQIHIKSSTVLGKICIYSVTGVLITTIISNLYEEIINLPCTGIYILKVLNDSVKIVT
jgi:lysophospholipase L1-like esterase